MAIPVQIAYRSLEPAEALNALVYLEAAKLERYFDGIVNCRVLIEQARRRHPSGAPYHCRIVLSVPGEELTGDAPATYGDAGPAVREAFRKARRAMQDYVQRHFRMHA